MQEILRFNKNFDILAVNLYPAPKFSAQEVVYCTLGMHLSECSKAEVYINVNKPTDKVKMLKSRAHLEKLSAEFTDVFVKELIEHYILRPDSANSTCLAHYNC